MRELNSMELQHVSGGFGLGTMVNSSIQNTLATATGRNIAINAASGMLNHAVYNLNAAADVTAATATGNIAAGVASGAIAAVTGPVGAAATVAIGGIGAGIGGAIERLAQKRFQQLEELDSLMNGGT